MPGSSEIPSYLSLRKKGKQQSSGPQSPSSNPQNSEGQAADQAAQTAEKYRLTAFMDTLPTHERIGDRSTSGERHMTVEFDPEVTRGFANWLDSYTNRLMAAKRDNPSLWNSDIMAEHRELYQQFVTQEGTVDSVDSKKIEAFLETSQGKMQAAQMIQEEAELYANALGLEVGYSQSKGKKRSLPDGTIALHLDRGALRKGWDKMSDPDYQKKVGQGALTTLSAAAGGALTGGPGGALVGATASLAPAAVAGFRRAFRPGMELQVRQNSAVFDYIKNNPERRAYVEQMTGLSLDTFSRDRLTGKIIPPDGNAVYKTLDEAEYGFRAVAQFHKALGADSVTGRQAIFKETFSIANDANHDRLTQDVQNRYKEKLKTLPDRWGQASDHPCYLRADCSVGQPLHTDALAATAAYTAPGNPGETEINNARTAAENAVLEERRRRGIKSWKTRTNEVTDAGDRAADKERERIFNDQLKKRVEHDGQNGENYFNRRDPDQVRQKQLEMLELYDKARVEAGSKVTADTIRAKMLSEAKSELTADQQYLTKKEDSLGQETSQQKELKATQEQVRERIEDVEKDTAIYDAQHEAEKTVQDEEDAFHQEFTDTDIDAAEKRISSLLDTNDPGSIRARRIDLESRIDTEYKALLKGKFGDPVDYKGYNNEEIQKAQAEFHKAARGGVLGEEAEQLRQDEEKLVTERNRLREIKKSINQSRREASGTDATKNVENLQQELRSSMEEIVGWGEPTLTQTELATLSYDELVTRINEIYENDPTKSKGWADVLSKDPDKRQKLLHAMLEARGLATETTRNVPGSDFESRKLQYSLIGPGGYWNMPDAQLRTLPRDEIVNILTEKDRLLGGGVPLPSTDQIDKAIAYAKEKVTIREEETKKLKSEFERQQTTANVEEKGIGEKNTEKQEKLKEIRRVLGRATSESDSIFGEVAEVSEHFDKYTNTGSVPKADTPDGKAYTEEERSYSAPEGYYQWLDFITNYQTDESIPDRKEAFAKARDLISKDFLAQVMNENLELGISGTISIESALAEIKKRGSMSEEQVFRVVQGVMRSLHDEAKAL